MSSIAPPPHSRRVGTTDSWVTPKWLLDRLGPFDLDPCAATPQPWPTAARMVGIEENGLLLQWEGFAWCNPPYGAELGVWLNRMALHGNGIALTFARTDTRAFQNNVFPFAKSLLFLCGRLTFHYPSGDQPKTGHNSGGPSVLIAYGPRGQDRLETCRDLGALVTL